MPIKKCPYNEYWKECISYALDDAGITATDEQIAIMATVVEGSHENYGMAFGHDCIPNPLAAENTDLKKKLKEEQEKILCEVCSGKGRLISYGGSFQSESQCWKCRGEGRHLPSYCL